MSENIKPSSDENRLIDQEETKKKISETSDPDEDGDDDEDELSVSKRKKKKGLFGK